MNNFVIYLFLDIIYCNNNNTMERFECNVSGHQECFNDKNKRLSV